MEESRSVGSKGKMMDLSPPTHTNSFLKRKNNVSTADCVRLKLLR